MSKPKKRTPWMTALGAVVGAIGWLSQPDVFNALPEKPAEIVATAGAVVAVLGLRRATKRVEDQVEELGARQGAR